MTDSENKVKTESSETKTTVEAPAKTDETPKPDSQDNLDELGYEKPKQEKTDGQEDKKDQKEKSKNDEGLLDEKIDVSSGYEKAPAAAPAAAGDKKEEAKPEDQKKEDDLELKDIGNLLPEEVNTIKEFAKKHKLSKDIVQGLVEIKKEEIKKIQTAIKDQDAKKQQEILKVKASWYDELKADSDFGGEKFDFSVKRVDKVIQDFLPNLKKMLTETKSMLPPYIMKDLAKLGTHLYSSDKLVEGEQIGRAHV